MDLYGYLGPPVLLFLFVNISSLISMVILFGEKPTPPTLSFMVLLPISPTPQRFHKAYATLNVTKKAFNSSMT